MKYVVAVLLLFSVCSAECVHEVTLTGKEIKSLDTGMQIYIEIEKRFVPVTEAKLELDKKYNVHVLPPRERDDYNKKYVEYYDYARLNAFLSSYKDTFTQNNYQQITIGKSLEQRDLYAVVPQQLEANKKTVVMFCRHHGDEGTANWIVEGFVEKVFADKEWLGNFQLILYPMILSLIHI